jgi:hypothetical protein
MLAETSFSDAQMESVFRPAHDSLIMSSVLTLMDSLGHCHDAYELWIKDLIISPYQCLYPNLRASRENTRLDSFSAVQLSFGVRANALV